MIVAGYEGIGPESGKHVDADDALNYAMIRCGITWDAPIDGFKPDVRDEFEQAFMEWFYSGNWVPVITKEA